MLFVVFTVALLTGTDLPYALAATVRSSAGQIIRPAHLLAAAALFMVILHETGRIPVETHTGTNEFGMIEEARPFEHSGPYFALLKWGGELKQLILYTILANVFLAPWGLAVHPALGAVRAGHRGAAGQGLRGRLRGRGHRQLLRQAAPVQDHRVRVGRVPARRARRVHAVPRGWLMDPVQAPGVYQGAANVIAAVMLLIEFGMLRQALARDQVRLYMAQSALISVLAVVIAADRNLPDLYALAALSGALKVVAIPLVLRRLLGGAPGTRRPPRTRAARRGGQPHAEPGLRGAGRDRAGRVRLLLLRRHGDPQGRPRRPRRCPIAAAMVLVAFGLMIVRRDVASQAIGFFSLENAISLAALVVAAGLPLILETAFLFDLLVAVVVFGDADPDAPRPGRVAVHRRPDQAAGVSRDRRRPRPADRPAGRGLTCASCPTRRQAGRRGHRGRGVACFGLVLALIPAAAHRDRNYLSYLRVDAAERDLPARHQLPVRGRGRLLDRLHQTARGTVRAASTPG